MSAAREPFAVSTAWNDVAAHYLASYGAVRRALRRGCSRCEIESLEDWLQEGWLALLVRVDSGRQVANPIGFVFRVASRARSRARRKRCCCPLEVEPEAPQTDGDTWVRLLRRLGEDPTPGRVRVLDAIENGLRCDKEIARALERHPSTIREAREGLVVWLREVGHRAGARFLAPSPDR